MSILKDLRALSRRESSPEDIAEFSRQVALESNDRGSALLVATNADLALSQAIYRVLHVSDDIKDDLDKPGGPLAHTICDLVAEGQNLHVMGSSRAKQGGNFQPPRIGVAVATGITVTALNPADERARGLRYNPARKQPTPAKASGTMDCSAFAR